MHSLTVEYSISEVTLYRWSDRFSKKAGQDYSKADFLALKKLEGFAKEQKMSPFVFLADAGISGTTFNRPAFQEALELVNQGRVRNFVVKDLSRFGREYLKVGAFTEVAFPEKNVRFIAIKVNVDSEKPEDNSLAPFCNLFNEWYARDCSKKITAVKHVKESYEWVVDEAARPVIQRIFHDYASGKSMSQIASEHVDDKILTPADHKMKLGIKVNKITSSLMAGIHKLCDKFWAPGLLRSCGWFQDV